MRVDCPLGTDEGGPSNALSFPNPKSFHSPLLITSANLSASGNLSETEGNHMLTVEKVGNVLSSGPIIDQNMEGPSSPLLLDSKFSNATMDPDDNMTLSHYQKDIKLDALERRGPSKSSSHSKKGRSPPIS